MALFLKPKQIISVYQSMIIDKDGVFSGQLSFPYEVATIPTGDIYACDLFHL